MVNKGNYESPSLEILFYLPKDIICSSLEEAAVQWNSAWDDNYKAWEGGTK